MYATFERLNEIKKSFICSSLLGQIMLYNKMKEKKNYIFIKKYSNTKFSDQLLLKSLFKSTLKEIITFISKCVCNKRILNGRKT